MKKNEETKKIEQALLRDIRKLSAPGGYLWAGIPHYKTLFGRDSLISALQMLDIDPRIAKATLRTLARYQGDVVNEKREEEPGKILHENRVGGDIKRWQKKHPHFKYWGFPYYGSADSTLLFVILAAEYIKKTGDKKFLRSFWPHVVRALNWALRYGDQDGDSFIEYQRKNPYGLYHQGWRDSLQNHLRITAPVALVEIQGYAYAAYKEGETLARIMKDESLAKILNVHAQVLKKKFDKEFWLPEEKTFALALDGKKRKKKVMSSNQGHLLFTGIVDGKEKEQKLVARLFQKDLWTPYGVRTLSSKDRYFNPNSYHLGSVWPHDNWFIYFGLIKQGYNKEATQIKNALFRAYNELGYIPEYYAVEKNHLISHLSRSCYPQAWAAAGLLHMLHGASADKTIKKSSLGALL